MSNLITIKDMYKSFFGVIAMDGMNFSLDEGEVHCLIGENGCGKSTMIKIISGYYPYDQGDMIIDGKSYRKINPSESMSLGIQVIYQDFSLFSNMTIAENIMMYRSIGEKRRLANWKAIREGAADTLKKIKFDINIDRYVFQLNVAERQMVAICRAITQKARLIVMDEPTTALTTREVTKLFDVVRELKRQGVAVLFVSHKLDEVLRICDAITVMRNGKNVYHSEPDKPLPAKEELVYYMTGRHVQESVYEFDRPGAEPIMEVRHYTQAGGFEDINFTLKEGEILGITGLLGCGREELAEALFGINRADSGEIIIAGKSGGIFRNVQDAIAKQIAYLPEDRITKGLHLEQSIAYNVVSRVIGYFANRLGILRQKELRRQILDSLNSIHISGMVPGNPVKSLSGGNQQKVVLVKWLAFKPKILILNCPTVGVDVGAKAEIHSIVKELAKSGIGVIFISDDIPEVMQTCNRVLIMRNGLIARELSIRETSIKQMEETLAADESEEGASAAV
ncbi:MAG: sugar ABC transporter ATP-binding protein [Treponema sp.]|jgi:simple sugar transport system ATP-binding protein|nr:sugar ABC transporter ATP-binding protein [Treponema sp.]